MSVEEFVQYIRILLKRWWLFLILCGTTLGSIMFSFYTAPPQYRATVRFLINAPPSGDVTLYPGFDQPTQSQQIAATQSRFMEILQSSTVTWQTVRALQASMDGDELKRRTVVDKPTDSEFIRVSVLADEPQEAADLANALVDTAKQYYGQILANPSALAREFISMQVEDAFQELQAAKQSLADFKKAHQVGDLPAEIQSQRNILWNLILEHDQALANKQTEQALAYDALISQRQDELQRLTALSGEYEDLNDAIKRAETYYKFLLDKETEAKLKENEILNAAFIQVIEPARPPREPVSPLSLKILALGSISSLIVSIVIAFALEYKESRQPQKGKEPVVGYVS